MQGSGSIPSQGAKIQHTATKSTRSNYWAHEPQREKSTCCNKEPGHCKEDTAQPE